MKKLLAVLMAVLVAFSALSVSVMAAPVEEDVVAEDVGIKNEDGNVVPQNFFQLAVSFFAKSIEKISSFFIGLFGEYSGEVDQELSKVVEGAFNWIDGLLSGEAA